MLDSIQSVLVEHIKDLYNAEKQLIKALPKMVKGAHTPELKEALKSHLEETKEHVTRLERVAELLDSSPRGKSCKGMAGLIEEGGETLQEDGEDSACDAALIAAAQKVEHYEISAYGTAIALAKRIDDGADELVDLLVQTLEEEKTADETLTRISETEVLPAIAARAAEAE